MSRWMKKDTLVSLVNMMLVDLSAPTNINYLWNTGSLLGINLVIQIGSGVFLAMHYVANIEIAYQSVEHIMRDVNYGWLIRYIHGNGASLFFSLIYVHMGRGLYHGSYTKPRVLLWGVGVVIYLGLMATAFLGYVLPWTSMSFWGATVITNMFSAIPIIGKELVEFIWGGYSVENPTLNRFYSFHYLLPFIVTALVLVHLIVLHVDGSSNPLGIGSSSDKVRFHTYYVYKDILGVVIYMIIFGIIVFYNPTIIGETPEADPLVTPKHIQPEWYFLSFYAILRAVPNKLLGVLGMLIAIIILLIMPYIHTSVVRSGAMRPYGKIGFWILAIDFIILGWLGAQPAELPYDKISEICTVLYFLYFVVIIPITGYMETLGVITIPNRPWVQLWYSEMDKIYMSSLKALRKLNVKRPRVGVKIGPGGRKTYFRTYYEQPKKPYEPRKEWKYYYKD